MLDWIRENYPAVSVLTNAGMLIVWIAYLQLFLQSYKRQRRAKILINVGAGRRLDARCFVGNMSAEPIYIESVVATLQSTTERWVCPVTEVEELTGDRQSSDPQEMTRQGPLMPGAVVDIGSFRDLIGRVLRDSGRAADSEQDYPAELTGIEIQAIADYSSEDLLVGASRRFDLVRRDGRWRLGPHAPFTEQIRSTRQRKAIRRMLDETP